MATKTREFSIVYGSYTAGGSSTDALIDGQWKFTRSRDRAVLNFRLLVVGTTAANFASRCEAAEDAFRQPRKACTITIGGATWKALSHTGNTGFDSEATISPTNSEKDVGLCKHYDVTVEFGLPADFNSGLREHTVDVSEGPNRRRHCTITGVYTALSSNSARTVYAAAVDALCATILTALTGSWERIGIPTSQDNGTDKTIRFTHVYHELIFSQAGSNLDDSSLSEQDFMVVASGDYAGDTPHPQIGNAQRLMRYRATYAVSVDKTVSTDLVGKWSNVIRPWIARIVRSLYGVGSLALVSENPGLNFDNNTINAVMEFIGVSGSRLLSSSISTEDSTGYGKAHLRPWDGKRFSAYSFDGNGFIRRTIHEQYTFFGPTVRRNDLIDLKDFTGRGKDLTTEGLRRKPILIGTGDASFYVCEAERHSTIEIYTVPDESGGSAGGTLPAQAGPDDASLPGELPAVAEPAESKGNGSAFQTAFVGGS